MMVSNTTLQQWRCLVLVYAAGNPALLSRIEAATSIEDLQRLFNEAVDQQLGTW
jgi:hypothetical protein